MNKWNITLLALTCSIVILLAATMPKGRTKSLVATTSWQAALIINKECSDGWKFKQAFSQNVSTSIQTDYYWYNGGKRYRDIKGDIILVFEK
jgi:hypothetical protein